MADAKGAVGHIKLRGLGCVSASFRQVIGGVVAPRLQTDQPLDFAMQLRIHAVSDNGVTAEVRLVLTHNHETGQPYDAEVTYRGDFELGDLPEGLTPQSFAERNAPAIIFPYLRETLTSLTGRGAPGPVFIPPVNVTALIEGAKSRGSRRSSSRVATG